MSELIVDLHVHSRYSRATSRECTLEGLYRWGKIKGISIIGTGDFTHPDWLAESTAKLQFVTGGLYQLREEIAQDLDRDLPPSVRHNPIYFVPSVEIATIYKKGGRVRKIHQLVIMPDLSAAGRLNERLARIGNLRADGRPILGMDAKDLLRSVLQIDPDALYIPAHIWTPWFGLFGSKSGFDSLEEAYEELAPEVRALETSLSSDPVMNARVSKLNVLSITSHSDAHSPQKLGREATVLHTDPTYQGIVGAIKQNDERLVGTIEFFPEEGKYHSDGHRACGVRFTPAETRAHKGRCPVCSRPLVVGVQYRVDELTDQPKANTAKRVEYIVPLAEVLAELRGIKSSSGKAVQAEYHRLIAALGSEFDILRKLPVAAIEAASPSLAHAVDRMRKGRVLREPGFDGVYGTIKVMFS